MQKILLFILFLIWQDISDIKSIYQKTEREKELEDKINRLLKEKKDA